MTSKIITWSFYLLFFLTPLVWSPFNFELFEYNKMMFVYFLTLIITACWLLKMIQNKSLILKATPLDIPLLLFMLVNIISTVISIDRHTSIWGYYSRSNGGLLSTISYITLYFALVSNFEAKYALKFLKAAIFGGVAVALWAIPEHFGVSPSCIILTHQANASCWVQDVEARVFATLGQPNWLAAYLSMLIFPALYFLLTSTRKLFLILNSAFLILLYLAFTFTYSRGATLGFLAGLAIFTISQLLAFQSGLPAGKAGIAKLKISHWKPLTFILASFFIVNLFFGSALTGFRLFSASIGSQRQPISISAPPTTTQMESEGTETGTIRLIVWRGALEIFKHYPIFGSGVETFAYSYYQFRPVEHNLVSEWDFLYNKAHNEFLNYLATTGIVGFGAYMAVILTFIAWSIKRIINYQLTINKGKNSSFINYNSSFIAAIIAAYISYLVQNFFGFSVVIIALFFYLFPALLFIITDSAKPFTFPKLITNHQSLFTYLYRRPLYPKLAQMTIISFFGLLIFGLFRFYQADILYAKGVHANDAGNPGRAYNFLTDAVNLNFNEPLYHSDLGYAEAAAASVLAVEDSSVSAQLKEDAIKETEAVLQENPNNVSFFRTAVRAYYMLSLEDKNYTEKTLQVLDKTIALSPTDPKLTYNKGLILGQAGKIDEAIAVLQKTVALKANYRDAHYTLGLMFFEKGDKEKAALEMKTVLKLAPNDPEVLEKLQKWQ